MGIDDGQMPIGLVWIGCLHRMGGRGGGEELKLLEFSESM